MKKVATDQGLSRFAVAGPRYDQEEAERFKAILRSRADSQFELDNLFSTSPNVRHQTRQKIEKLLRFSEANETMAPGFQKDLAKLAFVTDEEAKILGLTKEATSLERAADIYEKSAERSKGLSGKKWRSIGTGGGLSNKEQHLLTRTAKLGDLLRKKTLRLGKVVTASVVGMDKEALSPGVKYRALREAERLAKVGIGGASKANQAFRFGAKIKSASIAPNVDAWFEKNAATIKQATGPSPNLKLKATTSARPGYLPARHHISGGSA